MPTPPQMAVPLSDDEIDTLRMIAGWMIPASADFNLPGADDPAIVADIVASVGRDIVDLKRALALIDAARGAEGSRLTRPADLIAELKRNDDGPFAILESLVLRIYYRDDRVLQSIGMDVRPPFPKGYSVEEGDWSLLEPVKARGVVYRDADV